MMSTAAPVSDDRVALRIIAVTKTFGVGATMAKALDDVSLDIGANEFLTLLGPSGCGKTTLLRLLAGFEQPTTGAILLDGKDLSGQPPNRRPLNTVFQSYALFPHLTVERNVAFGLERLRQPATAVADRVRAMIRLVRLEGLETRRPHQLSGGQQQRVALARALAPAPRLLLLDEPLSALDLTLRRGMQVELKRLQRETGVTFILVTHDQEEALSMSDRIAVMHDGRVLQVGAPADIYARPNCRFVAEFVGEANVLPGALLGLPAPFAAIRPERIVVAPWPCSSPDLLPGRLVDVTFLGATVSCTVALDRGPMIKATRAPSPDMPRAGDSVACLIPRDALIPLDR